MVLFRHRSCLSFCWPFNICTLRAVYAAGPTYLPGAGVRGAGSAGLLRRAAPVPLRRYSNETGAVDGTRYSVPSMVARRRPFLRVRRRRPNSPLVQEPRPGDEPSPWGRRNGLTGKWRNTIEMADLVSSVITLALGGAGWATLNFLGKPIVILLERRRTALEVAERYAYVSIRGDIILVSDTSLSDMRSRPQSEYQTKASEELRAAGTALRTHLRECVVATRIYCWAFGYDLDAAARALLVLADAVRGKSDERGARRLTLHTLFVALGAAHHLSVSEIATARARLKQWRDSNRDTTRATADNA
jgi:hypothetical protein